MKQTRDSIAHAKKSRGFSGAATRQPNVQKIAKKVKCFACGKLGHFSRDCRSKKNAKQQGGAKKGFPVRFVTHIHNMYVVPEDGSGSDESESQQNSAMLKWSPAYRRRARKDESAVLAVEVDTGVEKCVLGPERLQEHLTKLEERFGVQAKEIVTKPAVFRFANSKRETTTRALELPIGIGGRAGMLRVYIIPGSVPLLVSRPVLTKLGGVLDLRTNKLTLHELGGVEVEMKTSRSGHLMIDLFDFPTKEAEAQQQQQGPFSPAVDSADVTVFANQVSEKKHERPALLSANVLNELGATIQFKGDGEIRIPDEDEESEGPGDLCSDSSSEGESPEPDSDSDESTAEVESPKQVQVCVVQPTRGWRRFRTRKSKEEKVEESGEPSPKEEPKEVLPTKRVSVWITDGERCLVETVSGKKGPPATKSSDRNDGIKKVLRRVDSTYGLKLTNDQCFQVWRGKNGDIDLAVKIKFIPTRSLDKAGVWMTKAEILKVKDDDLVTRWGMLDAAIDRLKPKSVAVEDASKAARFDAAKVSGESTGASGSKGPEAETGEKKRPLKRKTKKRLGKLSQMLMCLLTLSCGGWSPQETDAFRVEESHGVCLEEWPADANESWDHLESHPGNVIPDGSPERSETSDVRSPTKNQEDTSMNTAEEGSYGRAWDNLQTFRGLWNGTTLERPEPLQVVTASRVTRGYSWKRKVENLLGSKKSVVAGLSEKAWGWGSRMREKFPGTAMAYCNATKRWWLTSTPELGLHFSTSESEELAIERGRACELLARECPLFAVDGSKMCDRDVKKFLMKLHTNLGHPETPDFLRLLKNGGAGLRVLKEARSMKCDQCDSHRLPKIARPARITSDILPFDSIGMDVKWLPWWKGPKDRRKVLSILDYSSHLHQVEMTNGSLSSAELRRLYVQGWRKPYGAPKEVTVGPHRSNLGGEMISGFTMDGSKAKGTAGESHHQLGEVERHGKILEWLLKKIMKQVVPASESEYLECVANALDTKNSGLSNQHRS